MISTRYREKLPKQLSFPVGAKTISDALANLPQFAKLSITFMELDISRKLRRDWNEYEVLTIGYSYRRANQYSADYLVQSGEYDPKWDISVHSVPQEDKHFVATKLKSDFFPYARRWLLERQELDGVEAVHRIRFIFNEIDKTTRIDEFIHA